MAPAKLEQLKSDLAAISPEVSHAKREAEAAYERFSDLAAKALALGIEIEQECCRLGLPQAEVQRHLEEAS